MKRTKKLAHARRMMTEAEIRMGTPPFLSKAWRLRKEARSQREERRMARAAVLREKRRKERAERHKAVRLSHLPF